MPDFWLIALLDRYDLLRPPPILFDVFGPDWKEPLVPNELVY